MRQIDNHHSWWESGGAIYLNCVGWRNSVKKAWFAGEISGFRNVAITRFVTKDLKFRSHELSSTTHGEKWIGTIGLLKVVLLNDAKEAIFNGVWAISRKFQEVV